MSIPNYNIRKENIMQSTIGEGDRLTLGDIARCTGGGDGIGAKISRNLNRILTLRHGEGWITKQSVANKLDHIVQEAEKVSFNENIQDALKSDLVKKRNAFEIHASPNTLHNIKDDIRKIETISNILNFDKIKEDAKNTAEALKHIVELKKVDPMILLQISSVYNNNMDSKLVEDFMDYLKIQDQLPQSKLDIQKAYDEFLKINTKFINKSDINEKDVAKLSEYSNKDVLKQISFIKEEAILGYGDEKKLIERSLVVIAVDQASKKTFNTASFFEFVTEADFKEDSQLSFQIQRDIDGHLQDNISIVEGENTSYLKKPPIRETVDNKTPFIDFVPTPLKNFVGNDEKKIRMVAMLLTQMSYPLPVMEYMNKKYGSQDECSFGCSSFKYDFEIIDNQRQVRITNDVQQKFVDGPESRNFVITTYVNLDNPKAPIYIKEREISELEAAQRKVPSPITSALAQKDATYTTDGSGIVDFAHVNKEIGFGYVADGTGHNNPKMAPVLNRIFTDFNRNYQTAYKEEFGSSKNPPTLENYKNLVKNQLTQLGEIIHTEPEPVQDEKPNQPGFTRLDEPSLKPAFSFAQVVKVGEDRHLISAQFSDTILLIKHKDNTYDTTLAKKRDDVGLGDNRRKLTKAGVCEDTPLQEGDIVYGLSDGIGEFLTMEELQELINKNTNPPELLQEIKNSIIKKGNNMPVDEFGRKQIDGTSANGMGYIKGHDVKNSANHDDISLFMLEVA
jgi:hypothetical protein